MPDPRELPKCATPFDKAFVTAVVLRGGIETLENLRIDGNMNVESPGVAVLQLETAATPAINVLPLTANLIDFATEPVKVRNLVGDATFETANVKAGTVVYVRIRSTKVGGSALTFPAWTFAGAIPTIADRNKFALLTLIAFGDTDADILATWQVQP